MNRTIQISCAIVLAALLSGCLKTSVSFSSTSTGVTPEFEESQSFFLYGIVPDEITLSSSDVCRSGEISRLETRTTGLDGFLNIITFGIYTPKTLRVWCKSST